MPVSHSLPSQAPSRLRLYSGPVIIATTKAEDALLLSTLDAYSWSFCRAIIPRLFLVAFKYSQPFLIDALLSLLREDHTRSTVRKGRAIVVAYVLVYAGIAVRHQTPHFFSLMHIDHAVSRSPKGVIGIAPTAPLPWSVVAWYALYRRRC